MRRAAAKGMEEGTLRAQAVDVGSVQPMTRRTKARPQVRPRNRGLAVDAATPRALGFVDTYLAALLARASLLISGEFHRVVRLHGLSVPEWRVLASLSDGVAVSTGRLAQLVLAKQPALTRQLDRMQRRGQIERFIDPRDRRYTWVRITPSGRRVVSQLIDLAREHERHVLRPFGLERAEQLKSTLRRIIELHETPARR